MNDNEKTRVTNPVDYDQPYVVVLGEPGENRTPAQYTIHDFAEMGRWENENIEIHFPGGKVLNEHLDHEDLFEHLDRIERTPRKPVKLIEGELPIPMNAPYVVSGEEGNKKAQSLYTYFHDDPGGDFVIMDPDSSKVLYDGKRNGKEWGIRDLPEEYQQEFAEEKLQYLRSTKQAPSKEDVRVEVLDDNPAFEKVYTTKDFDDWLKGLNQARFEGTVSYRVVDSDGSTIFEREQRYNESFQDYVRQNAPTFQAKQRRNRSKTPQEQSEENAKSYNRDHPSGLSRTQGLAAPGGSIDEIEEDVNKSQKEQSSYQTETWLQRKSHELKNKIANWKQNISNKLRTVYVYEEVRQGGDVYEHQIGKGTTITPDGLEVPTREIALSYGDLGAGERQNLRRQLEQAASQRDVIIDRDQYRNQVERFTSGNKGAVLIDDYNHSFTAGFTNKIRPRDRYILFRDGVAMKSENSREALRHLDRKLERETDQKEQTRREEEEKEKNREQTKRAQRDR